MKQKIIFYVIRHGLSCTNIDSYCETEPADSCRDPLLSNWPFFMTNNKQDTTDSTDAEEKQTRGDNDSSESDDSNHNPDNMDSNDGNDDTVLISNAAATRTTREARAAVKSVQFDLVLSSFMMRAMETAHALFPKRVIVPVPHVCECGGGNENTPLLWKDQLEILKSRHGDKARNSDATTTAATNQSWKKRSKAKQTPKSLMLRQARSQKKASIKNAQLLASPSKEQATNKIGFVNNDADGQHHHRNTQRPSFVFSPIDSSTLAALQANRFDQQQQQQQQQDTESSWLSPLAHWSDSSSFAMTSALRPRIISLSSQRHTMLLPHTISSWGATRPISENTASSSWLETEYPKTVNDMDSSHDDSIGDDGIASSSFFSSSSVSPATLITANRPSYNRQELKKHTDNDVSTTTPPQSLWWIDSRFQIQYNSDASAAASTLKANAFRHFLDFFRSQFLKASAASSQIDPSTNRTRLPTLHVAIVSHANYMRKLFSSLGLRSETWSTIRNVSMYRLEYEYTHAENVRDQQQQHYNKSKKSNKSQTNKSARNHSGWAFVNGRRVYRGITLPKHYDKILSQRCQSTCCKILSTCRAK